MKQRGRKGRLSLSVVGGPRLVASSPPDDLPSPPDHLGEPERAIWDAIARDWKGTPASFFALTTALEAHQRARECREIIEAEGMMVTGRDGQAKAHPLLIAERASHKQFLAAFKQLGIRV